MSSPWLRKQLFVYGGSGLLVAGTMGAVATMDSFLFKNPRLESQLREKQEAYGASLLVMSNPWGTINVDDPAAFLMSLLAGADGSLREQLRGVLSKISPDRLNKLASLLNTIELNDKQKSRFARLLIFVLGSDSGSKKMERVLDILERLSVANQAAIARAAGNNVDGQAIVGAQGELLSPESGIEGSVIAPIGGVLLGFLDIEDPAVFDQLIEMLIQLPEGLYNSIMKIVVGLPPKYAQQLVDLVQNLNAGQTQKIVSLLEQMDPPKIPPLLDQLFQLGTSQIMQVVGVLDNISSSDLNLLASLISNFSKNDFLALISIADKAGNAQLSELLQVGKRINSGLFASATQILDQFNSNYIKKAINIMSGLDAGSISKLANMEERLNFQDSKLGIDVLTRLRNSSTQSDLLQEASYLSRSNLSRGIQVMDDVKSETVEQMVVISKGLSSSKTKNMMADQMYRIRNPFEGDVRGTVYTVRTPTAVAGVRGKTRFDAMAEDSSDSVYSTGYPYQPPKLKNEAQKDLIQRVEHLVQKMVDINDNKLNEKLLIHSDDLDSRGLVRGADVYIKLELGNDQKRAHRLVDNYGRTDVQYRTSAIDTLHDISSKHVNAAVDIVANSDDQLLRQSIAYTERLKTRLGEKEGLAATERVINVASRVETNHERQRGLDALEMERDVRVRRILKQVDGNMEPPALDAPAISDKILFNHDRIVVITELYHELRETVPQESPSQRTPAIELADVLSGSEGLTLGAKERSGTSRFITQERKLFRIAQYLDESKELLDFRVENITSRPVQVTHERENNFVIKDPEAIKDESSGVYLIKPQTSNTGL